MCGRYNFDVDDDFYRRYAIANKIALQKSYNVAPTQLEPVVLQHSPNHVELMYWGLIPFYEEKKAKPFGLINMRDDTVLSKGWAHKYIQFQRCIVPATGFYEWKKTTDGKIPYHFFLKDKKYFSFAGMYSEITNQKGEKVRNYTIITTTPNKLMEPIHNRMPVILHEEDENTWLNPDNTELDQLKELLKPYPEKEMDLYPISSAVNSPRNNTPEVLKRLEVLKPKKDDQLTMDSA